MIRYLLVFVTLFFIGCNDDAVKKEQPVVNRAPIAEITASKKVGVVLGEEIFLDGRGSTDSDGQIVKYEWIDSSSRRIGVASTLRWTAPSSVGNYTIKLKVTDDKGAINSTTIMIEVQKPLTPYSAIQNLIASKNAIYICVGDSTRAAPGYPYYNVDSSYKSAFVFPRIKSALDGYQADSFLLARQGHEAKQFNLQTEHPTWLDVVNRISASGDTTGERSIVDISLGINDLFSAANNNDGTVNDIKGDIRSAIAKIRQQKPKTHFLLTMPNPKDPLAPDAPQESNVLRIAYQELSNELNLPLVDVIDDINFQHAMFKNDAIHFHLIQSAQEAVADLILSKILP